MDRALARRLALWCGPLTVAVSAVGILAATLSAPWFTWTGHALSDLGAIGRGTAPLFNGTLIAAGVLGAPFVLVVFQRTEPRLRRIGTLLVGVAMPALALIGVFPLPRAAHAPVSIAFFVLFTAGIAVDGIGARRAGRLTDGAVSIASAAGHVLAWIAAAVAGLEGIALPEIVGAAALWLWVIRRFLTLRDQSSGVDGPTSSSSRSR